MKINYFKSLFENKPYSDVCLRRLFIATAIGLSVLLAAQYLWTVTDMKESAYALARADAASNFKKDFAYRRWTASCGGVYVPISDKIVPNPYLKIPHRDVVTVDGQKLTKINPAYLTRLANEEGGRDDGDSHVHLTSLKPINPINIPDEWERKALTKLAAGAKEVSELVYYQNTLHLRLMRPLPVESSCLNCHAEQGYKLGDLRGGLTVSIPFDVYLAVVRKNAAINFFWHFSTWLFVMFVLVQMYRVLKKSFMNRDMAEAMVIDLNMQLATGLRELHEENKKVVIAMDEQERLKKRLSQAEKMEAIGTLAGGIAHDFNNILSVIFGYADISKRCLPPESDIVLNLNQILKASERARDLVRQILCFSRQNKGEPIPMQLAVNVKEILKMIRSSLPTTIEIIKDINEEQNFVYADPTQVHQIVMNLCTNAFHAMEKTGGELRVSLKKVVVTKTEIYKHPDAKVGEYMKLSVCDSGCGIDPAVKEKIFEPYFTTKGLGEGTGMGLAIVHGIVANYGGFIDVYSEPEKGTSFNVFIPIWHGEKSLDDATVDVVIGGKESILFVDDDVAIVKLAKQILGSLGYDMIGVADSVEALEIFKKNPDVFDLIITDQTMPKLTGDQLSRKMIEIRPDIPIIMCTGHSSIINEEMSKAIGIKKFVLKPMSIMDMSKVIRKVLDNGEK